MGCVKWPMRTQPYPSDITDEQWALVAPHLPVYPGGRPRTTDLRDVVDAILYVLRTGCQWRYLPKSYPKWASVYSAFRRWSLRGVWDKVVEALRVPVRVAQGRKALPTAAVLDTQSVKTTEKGALAQAKP